MDPFVVLTVALLLLLALLFTGLPVFVVFLLIGVVGVVSTFGAASFGLLSNSLFSTATSSSLATIPAFILMGEILFRSGASSALFESVDRLVGSLRGRQFMVAIIMATIFGALSGAAMAVTAMLGRTLLPDMAARGYNTRLSAGTILSGACLAPIIPPSVFAIIIGMLANVSIADLLMGGILPGIMLAALFFVYVGTRVWFNDDLAPTSNDPEVAISWRVRALALLQLLPLSGIIFMVMGLILLGVATPTEAGATGVLAAVVAAAFYRRLSLKMLWGALTATARVTCMILVIMSSAALFSQLLSMTGALNAVTEMVAEANLPRWVMLAIMLLLPFILCMFLDQIALMLVFIPIFAPLVLLLEFDPVWFWILFLINISVGAMTPPFGYTLFVLKATAPDLDLRDAYAGAWPFVGLYVLGLLLLIAFPQIVLLLPGML